MVRQRHFPGSKRKGNKSRGPAPMSQGKSGEVGITERDHKTALASQVFNMQPSSFTVNVHEKQTINNK